MAKSNPYKSLFEGKGLDELLAMQNALNDFIANERETLVREKEQEVMKQISIGDSIDVMDGKGKDAKKVKARVITMTENGISAVLPDGRKINRRYRKIDL